MHSTWERLEPGSCFGECLAVERGLDGEFALFHGNDAHAVECEFVTVWAAQTICVSRGNEGDQVYAQPLYVENLDHHGAGERIMACTTW